ncbi:MAG: glycoside hydrolase 100 family protein [Nanoarchaeota archaeon]
MGEILRNKLIGEKSDLCFAKSVELLEKASTPNGFFAAFPGYDAVWARDSMIISLGSSLLGADFRETFKNSLITLAKHQSEKGQIPNAVDIFSKDRKAHVDFKSIDSSLWFIIGCYVFKERYRDLSLFEKLEGNIKKALVWLSYQDMGEDGLLEQLPTTDWQDAFPHRYGHTINTQALYYKVLIITGKTKEAEALRRKVNEDKDDCLLWNGNYYYAYRWKNHNKYREIGEWFDSLGNLLAILFGLADELKAKKIISYIKKNKIDFPFPVKAIYPPIKQGTKEWKDYFKDSDAGKPFSYLNGGVWPYIGSFYVLSLIKLKMFKEAKEQLEKVAEANLLMNENFSEWIHGKTGKPSIGGGQGWNAGTYILAYESLKNKRVLLI